MIGVVQKFEFTKNGAKKLQIDGGWYFAGSTNMDGVKVGDRIEFTFTEFGEDRGKGRLKGLDKWRPVLDDAGKPETASTVTEGDILRSVSNVVGNACAAGMVKSPEELEKWFVAAYCGFMLMGKTAQPVLNGQAANEPDPDDSAELERMAQQQASKSRW
jgi:hypothetical protein